MATVSLTGAPATPSHPGTDHVAGVVSRHGTPHGDLLCHGGVPRASTVVYLASARIASRSRRRPSLSCLQGCQGEIARTVPRPAPLVGLDCKPSPTSPWRPAHRTEPLGDHRTPKGEHRSAIDRDLRCGHRRPSRAALAPTSLPSPSTRRCWSRSQGWTSRAQRPIPP